ncbi:uncharacterized protein LOC125501053 isoform X1 [Athalia rosae]|uniref:uncharacterized protein LOC125501053 isoform X1 n=1 Tax=Athalia rosae TaxID=37344 RepID=UPI002033D2BE|nr:uncharacterized protein LOC125501053 isoform X1 [Athalia rosae]
MIIPPSSWLDYVTNLDRPDGRRINNRRSKLFPCYYFGQKKNDMVPALDWPVQSTPGYAIYEKEEPIDAKLGGFSKLLGLAPGLGQRVHFEEGLREQLRLKASIEEQDSWTGEEDYRKGR